MIFLILFAIASANAGSLETCTVGTWSDWSECTPSRHCSEEKQVVYSWPMPESAEWDSGREKMEIMMKKKQEIWQQREECRAAGTCPELFARPSSGSFECVGGLAGDVPCLNVDQLSFVNFVDLGYGTPVTGDRTPAGNDVWGWTDPLNGDEYAIIGLTGGTSFVRVTDPANPVTVGFIYTATLASTWRDIKVIGNYAYIVSEARNHGLQVFDLTRLRGRTQVVYDQPDAVNNDFGNAHNIAENSDTNFVYVVGATSTTGYPKVCKGGLLVIDVSNPLNPTFAGCFGDDGYVHDTQCVIYHGPDTRYTGREICFCFNEDSFTLVDVTDKSNMRMIAKSGYINVAYTHQGWVTEDHALVLLDDELDEYRQSSIAQYTKTYAWDVTDLQNPTLSTVFESSEKSIDHNQYIIGDLTYQANYESGLRILHIDRSTDTLSQVGYFDVLPSSTAAEFNGAWSVYPYFKSGTVVISSIDYGLFVVRPNISAIRNQIETNYAEQTRTRSVVHSVPYASCPPLVETRTCKSTIVC